MSKKIYEKMCEKCDALQGYLYNRIANLDTLIKTILEDVRLIKNRTFDMPQISNMEKTIASQQRTIEALTNALQDKYEKGLFVYSEGCEVTKVIRNGKELTNPYVRSLCVSWDHGSVPEITIDEAVGTFGDEE